MQRPYRMQYCHDPEYNRVGYTKSGGITNISATSCELEGLYSYTELGKGKDKGEISVGIDHRVCSSPQSSLPVSLDGLPRR
jgi:hypothetical protein